MARYRMGTLAAGLLAAVFAIAQEPWGYVWVFRTAKLYSLGADEIRIGRLTENDVVLTSPMVSRRHAAIRHKDGGSELIDIGSSNGSRLNGRELRPRFPLSLAPGARIQLADELLLYHESLPELWGDELEHRLLSSFAKLNIHLPEDTTRRSFGREEIVPSVSEVRIDSANGKAELTHSIALDETTGFPQDSAAFIGSVAVERGVLELSLWTIASGSAMTSRRSSISNLKHTTLRISVEGGVSDGTEDGGRKGPWFPYEIIGTLFDVFPDDPEYSLRFASSLASQERPVALRDAAATLAFRHRIDPGDWNLLLLAAEAKASFVEREVAERSALLTDVEKNKLEKAVEESRRWLDRARELGAEDDSAEGAAAAMARAEERLARIRDR
ncbi:MAG TPA: FHA domain-containing protein [Vicinamibacteria bacterium]|nr:FHA domain-containing protein [Vicinamibacteria bacterium]